jgi:hypothetical protein
MLSLARLRSAISFASLFDIPDPTLVGLCSKYRGLLGELGLSLAGDNDPPPPPGRVGLVGVDWGNCGGMFEVVLPEVAFIISEPVLGPATAKAQSKVAMDKRALTDFASRPCAVLRVRRCIVR